MSVRERRFRRAPEDERRAELIEATLQVIADEGLLGATVRNIAARTEVTAGLIRHYFAGKDELIHEAYRVLVQRMVALTRDAINRETEPLARLRAFIATQFGMPLFDGGFFRQWAIFVSLIHLDAKMAQIHHDGFAQFKSEVEDLVGPALRASGRDLTADAVHRLTYAVNGVIDGLWLEGCLHQSGVDGPDFEGIAVATIETLLAVKLPELAPRAEA